MTKRSVGVVAFAMFLVAALIGSQFYRGGSLPGPVPLDASDARQGLQIRHLPLSFERDERQASEFDFISRNAGRAVFLAPDRAVIALPKTRDGGATEVLQINLVGSRTGAEPQGVGELRAQSRYIIGNDPRNWHTAAHYSKARFSEVYPGIDVVYYGNQEQLEYDFVVKPGASPDAIALEFDGAASVQIDDAGDLVARLDSREVRQHAPVIYQQIDGIRKPVAGSFIMRTPTEVGFHVGEYDEARELVIDPVLVYSTYLGGSDGGLFNQESGNAIAVDSSGSVYLAGMTPSADFPTREAFQQNSGGLVDCFVTKLNPDGSDLIYSTYLGGSGVDLCEGLTLDAAGNVYVAGYTESLNFPVANPYQAANAGITDGFVTKLSPAGTLLFSTYLGGSADESIGGIKVDASGNIYVGGSTRSSNFPTVNAVQPNSAGEYDCFITKFSPAGNSLVYSTYLGGLASDSGQGFTADAQGNAYITGVTISRDYPVSAGAFQTVKSGTDDAFVTKLGPSGAIVYSTYFGGNGVDNAREIIADSQGNAVITGFTRSLNLPRRNAFQTQLLGSVDSFITKVNSDGKSLVFSTLLGGSILESGFGLAVDGNDNVYATGRTNSGDFPLKKPLADFGGVDDIYVTKFTPEGALLFSTPLGGDSNDLGTAAVADEAGNVYVTGLADFGLVTTPGAFQSAPAGGTDAFVAKINTAAGAARSDFDGDKKTDIAVFRPTDGNWYILQSSNNAFRVEPFGMNDDRPVPGDYDADGLTDIAVYRRSVSTWYMRRSSDNSFDAIAWGSTGDDPVQGDYDADGKTDLAVFRPSIGFWLILQSSDNGIRSQPFGVSGDIPVQGDYDGDERTDLAFFAPGTGSWSIMRSFTGFKSQQFGLGTDVLVPADYDGDGKDDISVFRPQTGVWFLTRSRDGSMIGSQFGAAADIPVPGDYDGDRIADQAVFRSGIWYIRQSSDGAFRVVQFGAAGDIPIPSAYQP